MNAPDWNPPDAWLRITTIDAHTAGEPLRIVTGGWPDIPGATILAKRRYAREHHDSANGCCFEEFGNQVEPIHIRQTQVQKHDFGHLLPADRQPLGSCSGQNGLIR